MTDQERQKAEEMISRLEIAVGQIFPRDGGNAAELSRKMALLPFGALGDTMPLAPGQLLRLSGYAYQATFTVAADETSLCALTRRFVSRANLARELCAVLRVAELAREHGLVNARRALLNGYARAINRSATSAGRGSR